MFILGADRRLRVYNPKAQGPPREVQRLQPQLLDDQFIQATPSFWHEPLDVQEELVHQAFGEHLLDLPYEVVEARLNSASSLLALVGAHRVSVVVLPAAGRTPLAEVAPNEVSELLSRLGLHEYSGQFHEARYESAAQLYQMSAAEREQLKREVNMKPGHAHTLAMHLDGRLPLRTPAPPVGEGATRCWAVPLPLPSRPPSAPPSEPLGAANGRAVKALANHSPTSAAFSKHERRE
eukprot:4789407-Prymnesium_polylepis.1